MAWFLAGSSARADEKVYQKAIPSIVLIVTPAGGIGTGVLVDVDQRLVVTADHVAGKNDTLAVVFPEFDRAGRPITEAAHYAKSGGAIRGKVLARRPACDLALIRIDSVPPQGRSLPLSAAGAREGQSVQVIGNSNVANGALFGCASGHVRNVFTKKPSAKNPLAGRVVLTSVATNRGDSGGPLVSDNGELVGIVSRGSTGAGTDSQQVVDCCVDVSEIRTLLDANRPRPAAVGTAQKPSGSTLEFNPYELQPATRVTSAVPPGLWKPPSSSDRPELLFPPLPLQHSLMPPVPPVPTVPTVSAAAPRPSLTGTWRVEYEEKGGGRVRIEMTLHTDGSLRLVQRDGTGRVTETLNGTYSVVGARLTLKDDGKAWLQADITKLELDRMEWTSGAGKSRWTR